MPAIIYLGLRLGYYMNRYYYLDPRLLERRLERYLLLERRLGLNIGLFLEYRNSRYR